MKRLFWAIDLPQNVREELAERMAWMLPFGRRMRLTPPQNYHITIKFLAAVAEERIPDVISVMSQHITPHTVMDAYLEGHGVFPSIGHPAVFWAGAQSRENLSRLFAVCEKAMETLAFAPERREFSAHVTLARVPAVQRVPADFLRLWQGLGPWKSACFRVDRLVLYESLPGDDPVYRALAAVPLP